MSKRWAKVFTSNTPHTKLVRVEQTNTGNLNQCYQNAIKHANQTGSKMIAGWIVMDGKYSSNYANNQNILAFAARHWWNKHLGRYVDTTPFLTIGDISYVVQKDITQDNIDNDTRYLFK